MKVFQILLQRERDAHIVLTTALCPRRVRHDQTEDDDDGGSEQQAVTREEREHVLVSRNPVVDERPMLHGCVLHG